MAGGGAVAGGGMLAGAAMSPFIYYNQAQAMKTQGNIQGQVADENAQESAFLAKSAIDTGNTNANLYMQTVRKTIGSQRASMAAQGVDVNSGSAAEVQKDTAAQGAIDVNRIRTNAYLQALGFKAQQANYTAQGQYARIGGKNMAFQTMLTGGLQATGMAAQGANFFAMSYPGGGVGAGAGGSSGPIVGGEFDPSLSGYA